jgi:hypothetical protein
MTALDSSHFKPGVIFPIELPQIRDCVAERIASEGYRIKPEHHITLISSALREQLTPEHVKELEALTVCLSSAEVSFEGLLYVVAKPREVEGEVYEREALVVPVTSPVFVSELARVASRLEIELPEPFLHVTVATRPDTPVAARGISIKTSADWEALSPKIFATDWVAA